MTYKTPNRALTGRWKRDYESTYTYRPERKGHDNRLEELWMEYDLLTQIERHLLTEKQRQRKQEIIDKSKKIAQKGAFSKQLIDFFLK